jgi:tetratricopeptide (TPR) repeat protein
MASPHLILSLLVAIGFSLAVWLGPRSLGQGGRSAREGNLLTLLLGDGRRMFADYFFTKADVYFHGGYYPSIFDQGRASNTMACLTGAQSQHEPGDAGHDAHEKAMDFLGKPKDWIDRFGRHFCITEHAHLEGGGAQREILPWLRISAELDPGRVETYTVAAYWLRKQLGKVKEAEAFLREGLRANPDSAEILTELGRLYYESYRDPIRARNVCELALRKWEQQEAGKPEPDWLLYREITAYLAHLEEKENNFDRAVRYWEMLKETSPAPAAIQQQIDELKQRAQSLPQPSAP